MMMEIRYFVKKYDPYPKASIEYKYYEHIGVLIYSKSALEFFASTDKGYNEKMKDVNGLRLIGRGKKLKMIKVDAHSLSVDTPKDLEYVKTVIEGMIDKGGIDNQ